MKHIFLLIRYIELILSLGRKLYVWYSMPTLDRVLTDCRYLDLG